MITPSVKDYLKELIQEQLSITISSMELDTVGGGSINDVYRLIINGRMKLFLKVNSSVRFPELFIKESNGLEFLAGQSCILTPSVHLPASVNNYQLLLLEWIDRGPVNENFWKKFGEQLARLHKVSNGQFGFGEDNYMGSLRQQNSFIDDWNIFFIRHRLQPQIELARIKRLIEKKHVVKFESLFGKLGSIFTEERPSLLHGDLWSGNFMCNENSLPVLIDPAVYFGNRSVDLAMTTLFGGFDKVFYDAYHYYSPLPSNHDEQWDVCNLYPLLIHLNLFGSGYLRQIEGILRRFS